MGTEDYQEQLGARLRAIRNQQGLTLQQVEERSGGRWKAVVVGSYERGDRAVSVAKLAEIAEFYRVPVSELLPEAAPRAGNGRGDEPQLVLDLGRLAQAAGDDETLTVLSRYAERIQIERGDYNGRVLTLRADDIQTLAAVFDADVGELLDRLRDRAVLRSGAHETDSAD